MTLLPAFLSLLSLQSTRSINQVPQGHTCETRHCPDPVMRLSSFVLRVSVVSTVCLSTRKLVSCCGKPANFVVFFSGRPRKVVSGLGSESIRKNKTEHTLLTNYTNTKLTIKSLRTITYTACSGCSCLCNRGDVGRLWRKSVITKIGMLSTTCLSTHAAYTQQ